MTVSTLMGKSWRGLFVAALWGVAIAAEVQFTWANENAGIETRAIPNSPMKTLRPAATVPSQEENLQRQSSPPPQPGDLRVPSPIEMEQHCLKNPRCGQKLDQARQGRRPTTPLPAATAPSLEDNLIRQAPHSGPAVPMPRSAVPSSIERFFSWLEPLATNPAWAQTPLAITYTPDNRWNPSMPAGGIFLEGGYSSATASFYWLYNAYSTNQPLTENKPTIYLYANLPTAGYYLIDIVSSPSLTKFRHSSGAILETWDDRAGCGGGNACHHVTVDYYTAGSHFWYFWADPTVLYTYFYSVTLKSYP